MKWYHMRVHGHPTRLEQECKEAQIRMIRRQREVRSRIEVTPGVWVTVIKRTTADQVSVEVVPDGCEIATDV